MSFAKVYNIAEDTVKQMLYRGDVSDCTLRSYDIFDDYTKLKSSDPNRSNPDIYFELSQKYSLSVHSIEKAVGIVRKKS